MNSMNMNAMNSMNMNAMNSMNMNAMNMNSMKPVPIQLGQYIGMLDAVSQNSVQNKMRVGVAANAVLTERKKIAPY